MSGPHQYVDPPDVPEGMTLDQWRAARCAPEAPHRRGVVERLRRREARDPDVVVLAEHRQTPAPARAA